MSGRPSGTSKSSLVEHGRGATRLQETWRDTIEHSKSCGQYPGPAVQQKGENIMTEHLNQKIGRRRFIGTAATAGLMIIKPELVRGTSANSAVRVGLLGCGGGGPPPGGGPFSTKHKGGAAGGEGEVPGGPRH